MYKLSKKELVVRIFLGGLLFLVFFLIFSYIPANISRMPNYLPLDLRLREAIKQILDSIINPNLPTLGLLLAFLVFAETLSKGTKVHGFFVLALGIAFLSYIYLLFQGGTISLEIPEGIFPSLTLKLSIDVSLLMYLFMLPFLLLAIKGLISLILRV